MACNKPLRGWVAPGGAIQFSPQGAWQGQHMEVPCGQCMGCRLARTMSWSVRMMHEAKMHDRSCFVTLTYDNEHVPKDLSVDVTHLQKFFKDLRYHVKPKKIRYFASGEYGSIDEIQDPVERIKYISKYGNAKLGRPHYHAIIFGYWPKDSKALPSKNDYTWYESNELQSIWKNGFVTIGEVTDESAAYTARYTIKKLNASSEVDARFHYKGRSREFGVMSRRPGIGQTFYEKFKDELQNNYSVIQRGYEKALPRFYKEKFQQDDWRKYLNKKMDNIIKYRIKVADERYRPMEEYLEKKQAYFEQPKI